MLIIDFLLIIGSYCYNYILRKREKQLFYNCNLDFHDPSIIPTGNALRLLKSRKIASEKRNKDTFTTISIMRKEDEFKDIIREVGYEQFFVHYTKEEQIHMYCSQVNYPEIIIDATGSVVKKFSKLGLDKTNTIFLYQAIVYDELKRHTFTITNMLSERHNTICISNWLAYWMSCNVPKPKKVVCDQSLALLSSIVRTFTQYSSLNSYIHACAEILTKYKQDTQRFSLASSMLC